jgi:hypothetical protein
MQQFLVTGFVVAGAAIAILALRHTLRWAMSPDRMAEAEKTLPFLIGTIGGYYGLLTGFIVSLTWGDVQAVRGAAMTEVNALTDIDRIALALPGPSGPELKASVGDYLRSVIDHEIKAMARGELSRESTAAYGRLWSTAARARPDASSWESAMLARAFDKVGIVGEQRRVRILTSTDSLPAIVWIILLIGGVTIIAGATIVSVRYGSPVREMMIAVAAMLCVVLFAIYTMDRPYRHGFGPGAEHYEALWRASHSADLISSVRVSPPADGSSHRLEWEDR